MKYTLLFMFALTTFAGSPIEGFRGYKLGNTITSKAKPAGRYPYYYRDSSKRNRVTVFGDESKKITMIIVNFSYSESYKHKASIKAYADKVRSAIKKYGKGVGDETTGFRENKSYTITKDGREIMIKAKGPYVHVYYRFAEKKEDPKPGKKEKEEEI